jgi:hypothetical protein
LGFYFYEKQSIKSIDNITTLIRKSNTYHDF